MKQLLLLLLLAGTVAHAQVNNGKWMMQGSLSMGGYRKDPKPNGTAPFANFNMAIHLQQGYSPVRNFIIGPRIGLAYDLLKTDFDSTIVVSDNPPISFDLSTKTRAHSIKPNIGFYTRYYMMMGKERKHGSFFHLDLNYVPVISRTSISTDVIGFGGTVKANSESHTMTLNFGLGYTGFIGEYGIEFMLGIVNYTFDATANTHNVGGIFNLNQWNPTIGFAHYFNYKKKDKKPEAK